MGQANQHLHTFVHNGYLHRAIVVKMERSGPWLIGFNGFGRSAEDLLQFFRRMQWDESYNLLAIENPFHGGQNDRDPIKKPFSLEELRFVLQKLRSDFDIKDYRLFGFSMGGKIVSHLLSFKETQPIESILMAPEGYERRPFYLFVSRFAVLLHLSHFMLNRPRFLLVAVKSLAKIRILRKNLAQFLQEQISDDNKRRLIFNTWVSMRHLQNTFDGISSGNKLLVIYGEKDPVIQAKKLKKTLEKRKDLHVIFYPLEAKHNLFHERYTEQIKTIFNKKTPI